MNRKNLALILIIDLIIIYCFKVKNIYISAVGKAVDNFRNSMGNMSHHEGRAMQFENVSVVGGGGGVIKNMKIESDMVNIAATAVRVWFFNEPPITPLGDNIPYVSLYVDKSKLLFYVDVTMDALLANSTTVVGHVDLDKQYQTSLASTSLFAAIQTVTGFTPTSAGNITVSISVLKL